MHKLNSPQKVLLIGFIATVLILLFTFTIGNPPQCVGDERSSITNRCIIGANIGLGLLNMLAALVWVVAGVSSLALYLMMLIRNHAKPLQIIYRLLALIALFVAVSYAAGFLLFSNLDKLIRT